MTTILAGFICAVWLSFAETLADRGFIAWFSRYRKQIKARWAFVLGGRSACPVCTTHVPAIFLIPVLGYVFALGRCRTCSSPIPIRHLFLELGAWIWGMIAFQTLPVSVILVVLLAQPAALFLAYCDARTTVLPGPALTIMTCLHAWLAVMLYSGGLPDFLPGVAWYASLRLLGFLKPGIIGNGDALLILILSLPLGLMSAFLPPLAAILTIPWVVLHRRRRIPFGPGLIAAFYFLIIINAVVYAPGTPR